MSDQRTCCVAWDRAVERALVIVRGGPDALYVEALRGRCDHAGQCVCEGAPHGTYCGIHGYKQRR